VPDPLDSFRSNLRRLREERGLSQEGLALECDLHMGHVSKIERGERNPGVRTVGRLARGLAVPAGALFEGIDGRGRLAVLPDAQADGSLARAG
jgi:transcriptional regulator with XRE-family HTH domain